MEQRQHDLSQKIMEFIFLRKRKRRKTKGNNTILWLYYTNCIVGFLLFLCLNGALVWIRELLIQLKKKWNSVISSFLLFHINDCGLFVSDQGVQMWFWFDAWLHINYLWTNVSFYVSAVHAMLHLPIHYRNPAEISLHEIWILLLWCLCTTFSGWTHEM